MCAGAVKCFGVRIRSNRLSTAHGLPSPEALLFLKLQKQTAFPMCIWAEHRE